MQHTDIWTSWNSLKNVLTLSVSPQLYSPQHHMNNRWHRSLLKIWICCSGIMVVCVSFL
ncbi:hypothetical protein BDV41DRAFT_547716 [Aspergillus transmontanensis]|uniref:Uncharacterized protein n=1 Tax=Aspergillus transmontanensis TaxID=1034304 RepID=A0A5N6VLQ7_9EURO|nr:hypothetical protein BDV41DRAFT_547716 [Aspergillus transmontanensis]